ncbi:MAG: HAMP domain-containing sensor histidine kinase [Candidatus Limnocylindria bacterium]
MALLIAVLPPLLLVIGTVVLADALMEGRDAEVVAAIVVGGSVLWAALLAIFYARAIADDIRSLLSVAQRGDPVNTEIGDAHGHLAASLAERNRQVAALATETGRVPIDDAPVAVVDAVVSAVRSVMGDATWRCAILESENPALLPAGTYHGTDDVRPIEPIGDLERWAAVSTGEAPGRIEGPWGAFLAIDVAASDRLRSVLYAPWEGRPAPTPAEIDLLTLVGQHAGTAIEHSLLYAHVRTQADELNRLAAVQADFLRGVTHDLQTPLTSISALANELRADDGLATAARADLESISYQAERLRRMVSQLLVASRLEAGVFTPQQEVFTVAPLVERTWAALRADRPFELVVEGVPHLAVADPDRLEQVLWALFDNAVKYSPAGSPITVRIRPDGSGELLVAVSDAGTGMDAETVAHAFDQFFRSTQARNLAPDGSGVGLYAAFGLMRAMGGSIQIESRLGAGTSMVLRIPAEAVDEASA